MEAISNIALLELLNYIITGQFGMIDNWLLANWYGLVVTALGVGFFAKHQAAKSLSKKFADVVFRWRTSKADANYSKEELEAIGGDFVALADELEERVRKGFFTNRSG